MSGREPLLRIWVGGDPVPQGSKRAFIVRRGGEPTGRVAIVDAAGGRLAEWRAAIVAEARARHEGPPHEGPLALALDFCLRAPKRPRFREPATRPDWEKLARAVGDALRAAGVYRDDGQVTAAVVVKRYAEVPGVGVTLWRGSS